MFIQLTNEKQQAGTDSMYSIRHLILINLDSPAFSGDTCVSQDVAKCCLGIDCMLAKPHSLPAAEALEGSGEAQPYLATGRQWVLGIPWQRNMILFSFSGPFALYIGNTDILQVL